MSEGSQRAVAWAALVVVGSVGLARLLARGPRIVPGSRVLLVGDSLAVGLAPPLKQLADDAKVPFAVLAQRGTRIDQWATRQDLRQGLSTFKPTLTIVVLGTNDAYMTRQDAAQTQATALAQLRAIIEQAGSEIAWIGPPSFPTTGPYAINRDNGVRAMLEQSLPGKKYFRSDTMLIPRSDGLHPTVRGAAGWAGSIWRWLT